MFKLLEFLFKIYYYFFLSIYLLVYGLFIREEFI